MKFRLRPRDEPEINLIPFIDVLLVVLIFLMLSTTYSKFTELQVQLPFADAQAQRDYPRELIVSVSADGRFSINKEIVASTPEGLLNALNLAAQPVRKTGGEPVIIISADANATHQSVVMVMQACRQAGLYQVTFATQAPAQAGRS